MTKVTLGKDTSGRPLVVDDTWLAKLRLAESRLGHTFVVVQGSYRGDQGAAASADTHARAGAGDLRTWDLPAAIPPQKAVLELRKAGLIAWYRTPAQGFDTHIHALDYGNPGLDPSAQRQVTAWENGRNGLASNGKDDGPDVEIPKGVPMRVDGADISHWQAGTLDFDKAKKAGLRWVYHKCSEGTGYVDPGYATRRPQVKKAGLPYGAYHFARPAMSGGKRQAQYFLDKAKPVAGDMRPMLDLEDRAVLSRPALTAWVHDFVAEVVAQTGDECFIYTPFDLDSTFDCPLWVARYSNAMTAPKIPAPWKTHAVWQFSDGVYGNPKSFPGLGNVDLNTMADDPTELTRKFTLGAEMPLTEADLTKIRAIVSAEVALLADTVAERVLDAQTVINKFPGDEPDTISTLSSMTTNTNLRAKRIEANTEPDEPVESPPKV